jgi:hypothetical protein
MAAKIFINYRRGDDPGNTGRLFDRLQEAFQPDQLFMDVDSIKPGLDFVKVLDEQVWQCDIVLSVIGQNWINARDEAGNRRLDNPEDFVRIEIESALNQNKRVIPVLVGYARMPRSDELPEQMKPLARRHAVRLTHERFRADAQGLVKVIQEALEEVEALRREQAKGAGQTKVGDPRRRVLEADRERRKQAARQVRPDKASKQQEERQPRKVSRPLLTGLALVAGLVGVVAVWIATMPKTSPVSPQAQAGVLTVDGPEVLAFGGPAGGPFDPERASLGLKATGAGFHWSVSETLPEWLSVLPGQGDLPSDAFANIVVALGPAARSLAQGQYGAQLVFKNNSSNATVPKAVYLVVREVTPPASTIPEKIAPMAQRVVLYEEDPDDPQGKRFVGTAVWRTETVSPGPGLAPELAVRADVEIPERKMTMQWVLRRNTDKVLPASHTIEIIFTLPRDFPLGFVANVPGILMKQSEQTRGTPLSGMAVKVTANHFLIGLSAASADVQRNMDLLKQEWFDIPLVYAKPRRAIIAMEKGTPGDRAFAEAFAAWGKVGSQ